MKCQACGIDNPEGAARCGKCDAALAQAPAAASLVPEYGASKKKSSSTSPGATAGFFIGFAAFEFIVVPRYFPPHVGFDLTQMACAAVVGGVSSGLGHWVGKLLGGAK